MVGDHLERPVLTPSSPTRRSFYLTPAAAPAVTGSGGARASGKTGRSQPPTRPCCAIPRQCGDLSGRLASIRSISLTGFRCVTPSIANARRRWRALAAGTPMDTTVVPGARILPTGAPARRAGRAGRRGTNPPDRKNAASRLRAHLFLYLG